MPYRFREDIATADVAFEAWGASREELFTACALALLATMVHDPADVNHQQELAISVSNGELDLLLYGFLEELVFYKDSRQLLLRVDSVQLEQHDSELHLKAHAWGERIDAGRHKLLVDVKAVTLHRFQVEQVEEGWRAMVVLDV